MKKYRATIIISLMIIIAIIISVIVTFYVVDPFFRPDKDKIEKYFKRDKNELVIVADYFATYDLPISFNQINFYSTNYKKNIKDKRVLDAITRLLEDRRYSVIGKSGNTVYFQKWERGADLGVGLAYSLDGLEPVLQYLTKLEPLLEENWYFYEEDYNEWRTR